MQLGTRAKREHWLTRTVSPSIRRSPCMAARKLKARVCQPVARVVQVAENIPDKLPPALRHSGWNADISAVESGRCRTRSLRLPRADTVVSAVPFQKPNGLNRANVA